MRERPNRRNKRKNIYDYEETYLLNLNNTKTKTTTQSCGFCF